MTPTQLGRYRLIGELGRGAMGVVYRAEDPALERTVALKVLQLAAVEDREAQLARFLQEARSAGRLSHPGIITIHDVGREGELAYMAMELLQGEDLRQRLRRSRVPPREALELVRQVADALAYAHVQGVVHRDIKPGNIMLLPDGRAKLMDFGIARMQAGDTLTQTGHLLGTPRYMSPEQVSGKRAGAASDLFSLGVVLYELLTGHPPFSGSDTPELMLNIATAAVSPPSRFHPALPPLLDLIVAKVLAKSPEERYDSAREFAGDLHACLEELPDAPPPASGDTAEFTMARTQALTTEHTVDLRVDAGLRLPLARRFDSSVACRRLASGTDATLTRAPQRPSLLARLWRDPPQRWLAAMLLAGASAGLLIAFL